MMRRQANQPESKAARPDHAESNRFTTDDLAFSAYLRLKGYPLIKSDQIRQKTHFTFELGGAVSELKVEFLNSEFIKFYNELRNLKKIASTR
jgi:hypothetical protein